MTMFKPNLRVNELQVNVGGKIAFKERFHSGLNIIRGQNSSGKSTIMDFLYYGLGGDLTRDQWREAASQCDSVVLEVLLNGSTVTLYRDVEVASQRPMKIFYGSIADANQSSTADWETYPFKRGAKESFSQLIFRFLGLPEVEYGETNSRLTINQVLRLLYSDQMTSVDKIFRPVSFDLSITREAIGNLLCGAYSDRYYKALIRIKDAQEEFTETDAQVRFLIRTHGKGGHPLTEEWVVAEQRQREETLQKLNEEISRLEEKIFDAQYDDRLTLNDQQVARERVVELQQSIGVLDDEITAIKLSFQDTEQYIRSIEQKLRELRQSSEVVDELEGLSFSFCPSCFASVSTSDVQGACQLCKSVHDEDVLSGRILKLINEYSRQKARAEKVQHDRQTEVIKATTRRTELKELWEQASRHYTVSLRSPTSEMRSRLRELNRAAGYAYRDLEDLARVKAVVSEIALLAKTKDELQSEINELKNTIQAESLLQEDRLAKSKVAIEKEILDFLRGDLARQSTFQDAKHVSFSFSGDSLAVNGETYFSASSMVYLRNSFFASFLFAAANDPGFLHPRFLMMDTVEDKGLEPERSKNFQRMLFQKSKTATSDHQIIIATSMIAEELNVPEVTVGDHYTHEHRTLRFAT